MVCEWNRWGQDKKENNFGNNCSWYERSVATTALECQQRVMKIKQNEFGMFGCTEVAQNLRKYFRKIEFQFKLVSGDEEHNKAIMEENCLILCGESRSICQIMLLGTDSRLDIYYIIYLHP